jgi:hypothetical protein
VKPYGFPTTYRRVQRGKGREREEAREANQRDKLVQEVHPLSCSLKVFELSDGHIFRELSRGSMSKEEEGGGEGERGERDGRV